MSHKNLLLYFVLEFEVALFNQTGVSLRMFSFSLQNVNFLIDCRIFCFHHQVSFLSVCFSTRKYFWREKYFSFHFISLHPSHTYSPKMIFRARCPKNSSEKEILCVARPIRCECVYINNIISLLSHSPLLNPSAFCCSGRRDLYLCALPYGLVMLKILSSVLNRVSLFTSPSLETIKLCTVGIFRAVRKKRKNKV